MTKPKGLYAVINHRGPYETMYKTYIVLKKYIKDNRLDIVENAYSVDLLSYFAERNPDNYVIRISVGVKMLGKQRI